MKASTSVNTATISRSGRAPFHLAFIVAILFVLAGCSGAKSSQGTTDKAVSDAFAKKLKEADDDRKIGRCEKASRTYKELLNKWNRPEPHIGLALCAKQNFDRALAHEEYSKALLIQPENPGYLFATGQAAYTIRDYDRADSLLHKYLALNTSDESTRSKAENTLTHIKYIREEAKSYSSIEIVPVEGSVNTGHLEYLPRIDAREQNLVFTRRVQGQEDLYIAKLAPDRTWQASPIESINTSSNESGQCISADGSLILYTVCDRELTYGSCDLFSSQSDGAGRWTMGEHLRPPVNSEFWDGQPSLSADGRFLLFASSRPGGHGGRDLWIAQFDKEKKRWGNPVNLGPEINTRFNEETPFLHPDQRTLYFRSDRPEGFGGYDLFLSRLDSSRWSEPQNLGSPINTPGDEGSIVVNLAGDKAYYAMEVFKEGRYNKRGDIDLMTFDMPSDIAPRPMTFVEFVVEDANSGQSVSGHITIINSNNGQSFWSQDFSTSQLVCMPLGERYAVQVKSDGYLFYSEEFLLDSEEGKAEFPVLRKLKMVKTDDIPTASPIVMENVLFESGSANLRESSSLDLDELAYQLKLNPTWQIEISGHTDNVGSENDNLELSARRAESIKEYLVSQGIESSRISTRGYGESAPIADNNSDLGREKNRRVEFVILSK